MDNIETSPAETRPKAAIAFDHLLSTMREVADRFASSEWAIASDDDVADTLRVICHHLATGFETQFEQNTAHPDFRPIVTPWRKALGDNAYAMYHDAIIDPTMTYRISGSLAAADYVSFTLEAGADEGAFPTKTVGVLNDELLDADGDGNFSFLLGGAPSPRNFLALDPSTSRITVRHYWDRTITDIDDLPHLLGLRIEPLGTVADVPFAERSIDAEVASGINRLATYLRARTVDLIPPPGTVEPPNFVSQIPHEFPPPVVPGDHALAAADAAYSMAPYLLNRDEALVVTVRWPDCRCANVNLWTRHMQTFDYVNHTVALSRGEAQANEDGTVTVVISETDPGVPNWLTTEGRQFGLVFWRFMLPVGEIETPRASVMPTAEVRARLAGT